MKSSKLNQNINNRDKKIKKDISVVSKFIRIYCNSNHNDRTKTKININGKIGNIFNNNSINLCEDCKKLLLYSASMRIICPYDPKPSCKKCLTYCYKPDYRKKIKEVMKTSGMYLIKRGRIDLAWKYFF